MSTLKALTANRLSDGIAVWLGADGGWHESLDEAFVARHEAAVSGLHDAEKVAALDNQVVDVAVIDVEEREGHLYALRLRERIRALGPTVRSDLGKQVEQSARDDDAIAA
ncbi:DUF2849 domain-containing protein [Pararhizobium haloflavum]|uniref:DUF2849 domain-containing protein n=1 Tax=Pararhizobium haloflavum TaxID=2037914 RepID=UPI000C1989A1|nr:DUF2849 domain-containing protein [Pararhizobium haloflavum]